MQLCSVQQVLHVMVTVYSGVMFHYTVYGNVIVSFKTLLNTESISADVFVLNGLNAVIVFCFVSLLVFYWVCFKSAGPCLCLKLLL